MKRLLEGGRLVCTATGLDRVSDLLIEDGRIAALGTPLGVDAERLDCRGLVVTPSLVDLDAFVGVPGLPWREDLGTATEAACRGGFGAVLVQPGTDPVLDDPAVVSDLRARARGLDVDFLVAAAFTRGLEGAELAELGLMTEAGASAFSMGDALVSDLLVLRHGLLYARPMGLPVLLRAGEQRLESAGAMHEGEGSAAAGMRGMPAAAEEIGVAVLVALARSTHARVHVLGVSSALGVAAIRRAKAEGVPVTASVPSLNLVLDDEVVLQSGYDTDTRLLPPLRGSVDREALVAAVRDGTIDAVGSGHRPLTRVDKDLEFDAAVPGASTLETALSSTLEACGLLAALRALSSGPAGILGLDRRLAPGAVADLVLLDPEARWRVAPERFASKGRNTPLKGRELPGVVRGLVRGDRMARPATPAP